MRKNTLYKASNINHCTGCHRKLQNKALALLQVMPDTPRATRSEQGSKSDDERVSAEKQTSFPSFSLQCIRVITCCHRSTAWFVWPFQEEEIFSLGYFGGIKEPLTSTYLISLGHLMFEVPPTYDLTHKQFVKWAVCESSHPSDSHKPNKN